MIFYNIFSCSRFNKVGLKGLGTEDGFGRDVEKSVSSMVV